MKTKSELISKYAEMGNMTKKDAEQSIELFIELVKEELKEEGCINISGLGKFEVSERSERMGINPKTKEPMKIAASKSVKFKVAKNIKEIL